MGLLLTAGITLGGCGGETPVSSPVGQWCTDPARDASGNAVMTLVKKANASLPPKITVKFNDVDPVEFSDDGTGLDTTAGDGIYTRSVKVATAPTEHSCNQVIENTSSAQGLTVNSSGEIGSLEQAVGLSGSCKSVECPTNCRTILGGTCVICFRCDITITF